eukprot:6096896-Pyramimonas_sp.AAC.1
MINYKGPLVEDVSAQRPLTTSTTTGCVRSSVSPCPKAPMPARGAIRYLQGPHQVSHATFTRQTLAKNTNGLLEGREARRTIEPAGEEVSFV